MRDLLQPSMCIFVYVRMPPSLVVVGRPQFGINSIPTQRHQVGKVNVAIFLFFFLNIFVVVIIVFLPSVSGAFIWKQMQQK